MTEQTPFTDALVPDRLRQSTSPWEYHRGMALVVLYVIVVSMSLFWAVLIPVLHFTLGLSLLAEWGVVLLGLLAYGSQMIYFYRHCDIERSGAWMAATSLMIMVVLMLASGGVHSPLVNMMLCSTVIAFRTCTRRQALRHSIYVAIFVVLLYLLEVMHIAVPNYLSGFRYSVLFVISWAVSLVIYGTCMVTFHYQYKKLFGS